MERRSPMKGTNAVGGAFESTDESEACLDDAGEKPRGGRPSPALAHAHPCAGLWLWRLLTELQKCGR